LVVSLSLPSQQPYAHMSYAPQVKKFDDDDRWLGNGLRFATDREAEAWIAAAFGRQTLKRNARIIISDDPVNYAWVDGKLAQVHG
jgi:hypothetical protein